MQLEKMQLRKFLIEQTDLMSKTRLGGSSKVGPCLPYGTANRHCCHCTGEQALLLMPLHCGSAAAHLRCSRRIGAQQQLGATIQTKKQFKNTKWVGVYIPCSQLPRPTSCQSKFLATEEEPPHFLTSNGTKRVNTRTYNMGIHCLIQIEKDVSL